MGNSRSLKKPRKAVFLSHCPCWGGIFSKMSVLGSPKLLSVTPRNLLVLQARLSVLCVALVLLSEQTFGFWGKKNHIPRYDSFILSGDETNT